MTTIDTDYTFLWAQNILEDKYDYDNDGEITYDDYWQACSNNVEFTSEEVEAFKVIFLIDGEEEETDSVKFTDKNASDYLNKKLGTPENPANATTLNNLQEIGKSLTAYIRQCSDLVNVFDSMIKVHEENLTDYENQKSAVEVKYEEKVTEVEKQENDLKEAIKSTMNAQITAKEEYERSYENTFNSTLEKYKNGEYEGYKLIDVLTSNLQNVGFDTTKLNAAYNNNNTIRSKINTCCTELDNLTSEIREINYNYNTENSLYNYTLSNRAKTIQLGQTASANYEAGYQRRLDMREEIVEEYYVDAYSNGTLSTKKLKSYDNPQVQKLDEFLTDCVLETMPFTDAWEVLQDAFDNCGITCNTDGTIDVPKGHDSQSKQVYNTLVEKLKSLYGVDANVVDDGEDDDDGYTDDNTNLTSTTASTERNDPIGFQKDNISYNFISDRNGNGTFDNESEFLGAKNGWQEMEMYDLDGNGLIEGDELAGMNLIAVNNETGEYTFMNALDANIDSIDLTSYKTINKKQVNNNILTGTFNLSVDGDEITGKQTYDTKRNLSNSFGMVYGTEIKNLSDTYKANPFMEDFVEDVNTDQVVSSSKRDIENAKNTTQNRTSENIRSIQNQYTIEGNLEQMELNQQETIEKAEKEAEEKAEKEKEEEMKAEKKS